MLRRTPARVSIALLLVVAAVAAPATEPGEPLTEVEVVRMTMRGDSAQAIMEEIRRREVRFALDDEMADELRSAGVASEVIEAMRERMAESTVPEPSTDEPVPAPEEATDPLLRILLNPDRLPGKPSLLKLSGEVGFQMKRNLELDRFAEGAEFTDVAIFVACRSPTHVPDHWRSQSALGRDFDRMPRHRLLRFLGGARRSVGKNESDLLELEIPEVLEIAIEPDETHQLMLGVAVEIAGRYFHMANDTRDDVLPRESGDLRATIVSGKRSTNLGRVQVRFEEADEPPAD